MKPETTRIQVKLSAQDYGKFPEMKLEADLKGERFSWSRFVETLIEDAFEHPEHLTKGLVFLFRKRITPVIPALSPSGEPKKPLGYPDCRIKKETANKLAHLAQLSEIPSTHLLHLLVLNALAIEEEHDAHTT
jgi:hypothetical protein